MKTKEMHSFKIIASQGGKVVFDERVEAETPRDAREKMKEALGLESLTGLVYAITEIPMDLLREIVARYVAEITLPSIGGSKLDLPSLIENSVAQIAGSRIRLLEQRIAELEAGHRPNNGKGAYERFDALSQAPTVQAEKPDITTQEEESPNILKFSQPDVQNAPAAEMEDQGVNWDAIRTEYERTRSIKQTAAQFDVSVNTLKARVRRGGWGK